MQKILSIIQIALSIALIIVVLVQQRSSGAGSAFGSDSALYSTRRGPEKILFIATAVIATLFFLAAAAPLFIR